MSAWQIKSKGFPNNYFFCKLVQIEFYRKVVRRIVLENRPTIHVGEAHELFRRVTQQIRPRGLSNVFISEGFPQLKQIFCLEIIFIHGISMCDGIGEDSRHGNWACRHSSRNHEFT